MHIATPRLESEGMSRKKAEGNQVIESSPMHSRRYIATGLYKYSRYSSMCCPGWLVGGVEFVHKVMLAVDNVQAT